VTNVWKLNFIKDYFSFNCKIGNFVTDGPISKIIAYLNSPLKTVSGYVKILMVTNRWYSDHWLWDQRKKFAKSKGNIIVFYLFWNNLFDWGIWVFNHIFIFIYLYYSIFFEIIFFNLVGTLYCHFYFCLCWVTSV
jgi:hypothetical protein